MYWRPIRELYEPHERVATVWDGLVGKKLTPTYFANTELIPGSQCNIAIKLPNGHIVADDCTRDILNGMTFANEDAWKREVIDQNTAGG